jgi:hypothetical protein
MKKILVLIAINFACTSYAQDTIISRENLTLTQREILDQLIIESLDFDAKMEYRRLLGGHVSNEKYVFQNILLQTFRGTLNADSLIKAQPQLQLITVNEMISYPDCKWNAVDFFKSPDFAKYNTSDYVFSHRILSDVPGRVEEDIMIYDAKTRKTIRRVSIYYEEYSNQVRTIVDNCSEYRISK